MKVASTRDQKIDMGKMPMLKNTYNLERNKIYKYCQNLLTKFKNKVVQKLINQEYEKINAKSSYTPQI